MSSAELAGGKSREPCGTEAEGAQETQAPQGGRSGHPGQPWCTVSAESLRERLEPLRSVFLEARPVCVKHRGASPTTSGVCQAKHVILFSA